MATKTKEVCLSGLTFFGLTSEYTNQLYEQMFLVVMQTNFTFTELYGFTVSLRNWIINRTVKYFKESNKQ